MSRDLMTLPTHHCSDPSSKCDDRVGTATSENTQGGSTEHLYQVPSTLIVTDNSFHLGEDDAGIIPSSSSPADTKRGERLSLIQEEPSRNMLKHTPQHGDDNPNGSGSSTAIDIQPVDAIPLPTKPNPFSAFFKNSHSYFFYSINVAIGIWLGYGYDLLVKAAKDLPLEEWGLEWLLSVIAPISMILNAIMSISFSKDWFGTFASQWNKNAASRTLLIIGNIVGAARVFAGRQLSEDSLKGLPCAGGNSSSFQCTSGFQETQVDAAMPYNYATSALSVSSLLYLLYTAYQFRSMSKKEGGEPLAKFLKHIGIYVDKKRGEGKFIDLTQFPERTEENGKDGTEPLTEYQRFVKWFYQEADRIFKLAEGQIAAGETPDNTSENPAEENELSRAVALPPVDRTGRQRLFDYMSNFYLYAGGIVTSFSGAYFLSLAQAGNSRFGVNWGLNNSNEWYGIAWNNGVEQSLTCLGGAGIVAMYINGVRLTPSVLSDYVRNFAKRYEEQTCGVLVGACASVGLFSLAAVLTGIGLAGAVYSMGGNYGSVANTIIRFPLLSWIYDYVLVDPVSWIYAGVLAGMVNGRSVLSSINTCLDNEKYIKLYAKAYHGWSESLVFQAVDALPDPLDKNIAYITTKKYKNEKDEIETRILYSLITPDGQVLKEQLTDLTVPKGFTQDLSEKYKEDLKKILSARLGAIDSFALIKGFLSYLFNVYKMPIDGGKNLDPEAKKVWVKLEKDIRKLFENGQTEAELGTEIEKYQVEKTKYMQEKDSLGSLEQNESPSKRTQKRAAQLDKKIAKRDAAIQRCMDLKKIFAEIGVESTRDAAELLTTAESNQRKAGCSWGALFGKRREEKQRLLVPPPNTAVQSIL